MNQRERKLTLLLGLCTGVLVIAFFVLVVFPKYQELDKKADEATKAKNKAEAELAAAEKLDPKDIERRLTNLKCRIPSTLELSNVINRVDEIAVANKLVWLQGTPEDISTLTAGTAPAQGQTNTIAPQLDRHDFSIIVRGAMPDFVRFMSDLTDTSIGRIIVINNLDVQFKNEESADSIEATLKLQVVGWKLGADIGSERCVEVEDNEVTPSKDE